MHNYKISTLNCRTDPSPVAKVLNINQVIKTLTTFMKSSKNRAPAIVSGHFKGNSRAGVVEDKSLIFLDIDRFTGSKEELESLIREGVGDHRFIVYSTASHTIEAPRVRLVLFLDKELDGVSFKTVVEAFVYERFTKDLVKAIDLTASTRNNGLMFLPIQPHKDYDIWTFHELGHTVDTSRYLKERYKGASKYLPERDELDDITYNMPLDITDQEVEEALNKLVVAKYYDRDTWLKVGMGLHHQYKGSNKGMNLFDKWSSKDTELERYKGLDDIKKVWLSFGKNNRMPPITFATVLDMLKSQSGTKNVLQSANLLKDLSAEYDLEYGRDKFGTNVPIPKELWFYTKGKNKEPIFIDENMEILFKWYGFHIQKNTITQEYLPYIGTSKISVDGAVKRLESLCNLNNLPHKDLRGYILERANRNIINPWKDWIMSKPWDGKDRLEALCDTIEVPSTHLLHRNLYLRKWLIQMLHLTCLNDNELTPKCGRLLLVFNGNEEIGKSSWLKSLAPVNIRRTYIKTGASLNLKKPMEVLAAVKYVFVELSELTSSFKKTDDTNLWKAFISNDLEELDRKYQIDHQIMMRRTSFFGTTNVTNFLDTSTGSSRYLTLPVTKCNAFHDIDLQQLYAQLLIEGKDDKNFGGLTNKERAMVEEANNAFAMPLPSQDKFKELFDIECVDKRKYEYRSPTKVYEIMWGHRPKRSDLMELTTMFKKLGYIFSSNPWGYLTPPLIERDDLF